jgi:AraC family transcriptional regulator of adaptative response/methylated-DNA-[protein]-cysteine methyltransferase
MQATIPRATARQDTEPAERIDCTLLDTTLGRTLIGCTPQGVCLVAFADDDADLLAEAHARFPDARVELTAAIAEMAETTRAFIDGCAAAAAVLPPLDLRGTAFQRRVWEALQAIPAGETRTYSQLAVAIGRPTAVRAVASACGANPVAVLVPCHRVIASDGSLAGYRWGLARKRALLEREGVR